MKLNDGRVVTKFGTNIRSSHLDPTGGSMTMVSDDGDHTWKQTSEKFKDQQPKTADGRLVTASGRGWIYVPDSLKPKLHEEGRTSMAAKPGTIACAGKQASFNTSYDDGNTCTKKSIPFQMM